MYQEERLKEILSIIESQKIVSVEALQGRLYVSTSTVRRDLAELSRRGLVVRSSGGAVAMSEREKNDPLMLEIADFSRPQDAIGACAAQLVHDQETIFLSASASVSGMIPLLADKKGLTILTNSADVVTALCGSGIPVYCCSGLYSEHANSFCGSSAARFLHHFAIDTAFFTCTALTPHGALGYKDLEQMDMLQEISASARQRVLLCTRDKIGRKASRRIVSLTSRDIVITDAPELLSGLPCEILCPT